MNSFIRKQTIIIALLAALPTLGFAQSSGGQDIRSIAVLDLDAVSHAAADAPDDDPAEPPAEVGLTLEECRRAAIENNLALKVVLVNPLIAAETISQEEARFESLFYAGASFGKYDTPTASTLSSSKMDTRSMDMGVELPLRTGGTLTFDVASGRTKTNNVFSTLNPSYAKTFTASISQPLLRNAGTRTNTHGIRIAGYDHDISEARAKLEVIAVLSAIDKVYWRLYSSRRQLEVRKSQYDLAVAQLEKARRRVEAGASSEVEIIRAETGVAERLENIIVGENMVRQNERDLKRILNTPGMKMGSHTIVIPLSEPDPVHYELDTQRLIAAGVENRMEMREIELRLAREASTIDYNSNQTLPMLTLLYSYNVNGLGSSADDAYDLLTDKRFEDHSVGINLRVPLGNRAARSRLRQSVFTRTQTLANRKRNIEIIEQQVRDAVDALETSWQRVLANRQRTILAARNAEAEQRQFEQGLRTSTDVLDAQTQLADAQSAEVASITEYQVALVDLAFSTGTLLGAAKVDWQPGLPQADAD